MKIDFKLTAEDFFAFNIYHQRHSPTIRRQRLWSFLIGLAFVSAPAALILSSADKPLLETAFIIWPLLTGPIVWILFFNAFINFMIRRTTQRMISEGDNSALFGRCSLEITPEGLAETKPSGNALIKWLAIKTITGSNEYVFIYISALEALILPKRAFDSDTQCEEFVAQLAERSGVAAERG